MSHNFDFLINISSTWKEHSRLDVQLLLALCQLSIEKPKQIKDGYISVEIVQAISKIRGAWSDPSSPEKMSDDVRKLWNRLIKTWETKKVGIYQHLNDSGINLIPELDKTEGGGSGNPSYYRIVWNISNNELPVELDIAPINKSNPNIKYVCEDISDAGILARVFKNGYHLTTLKKILMAIVIAVPLVIAWLSLVFFLFGTVMWDSLGTEYIVKSSITLIIVCIASWISVGRLLLVPTNKIVLAPWWMQSTDDDRLLEHRHPPRFKEKSVKAVHYTASCPKCGGKVSATSGGLSFWGRIIGRCENSPNEHIYSFDHITRIGKELR